MENTRDVNEAYLLVHHVMAGALSRVGDFELDLGPVLERALDKRSGRLARTEASL